MTRISNGLAGGQTITGTDATPGPFTILKALGGDVVFDAVAGNVSGLAGQTLSNGDFIVGYFTSVKLTSGSLIAYVEPSGFR